MASKISVADTLEGFLDSYSHLAGSRDGYPKIALDLQSVRDLISEAARLVERERFNAWHDGLDSGERELKHSDSWSYDDYCKQEGIG
mgnify:CR=1 FL=1|jgi:hypothetical protein|tara:strand:+ start:87 stop:347 length:261 start_codon:yes stop_codon:yes gene_type:complete